LQRLVLFLKKQSV
ncbi:hexose phosphate transport protein, partial [Vibrio parahaemolyticus EKP-028]